MAEEKIKIAGIGDVNRSEFLQTITDPDKFKEFASLQGWGNKRRLMAWNSLKNYAQGVQNGDINEINDMHQVVDDTGARTNKQERYNLIGSKFDANGATAYYMNNVAKSLKPKEVPLKDLPSASAYLTNSWFGGNAPDWALFLKNDIANNKGVYSITNRTNKLREGLLNLYNELNTNGDKYNWGETNKDTYLANLLSAINNPNNVAVYAPLGINSEFLNNALSTKDLTLVLTDDSYASDALQGSLEQGTEPKLLTTQDIINSLSDLERAAYMTMTPELQLQFISLKMEAILILNKLLLDANLASIDKYKQDLYNLAMLDWYKTLNFKPEYSVYLPGTYIGVSKGGDLNSALRLQDLGFSDTDYYNNSPKTVLAIVTSTAFRNPNVRHTKTANGYVDVTLKNKLDVLAYMLDFQSKNNPSFKNLFTDVSSSVGKPKGTIYRIEKLKGNDGSYVYVRKNGSNYEFYRSKPMNVLYKEHLALKHKLGGVIAKYLYGGAEAYIQKMLLRLLQVQKQQLAKLAATKLLNRASYVRTVPNTPNNTPEFTTADKFAIGTALADVAASFFGNPFANTVTSVASIGTGIASDISHGASWGDAAKNAGIGALTGVAGFIPGLGFVAKSKRLLKVLKVSGYGLMAALAGAGLNDAIRATQNIIDGNFDANDVKTLIYGMSSLTHGVLGGYRNYKQHKEAKNIVDKAVDKNTGKKVFINEDPERFYFLLGKNKSGMMTKDEATKVTDILGNNGSWESLPENLRGKISGINFGDSWWKFNRPKLLELTINANWESYLNKNVPNFFNWKHGSFSTPSRSAIRAEVYSRMPKGSKTPRANNKPSYEWESPNLNTTARNNTTARPSTPEAVPATPTAAPTTTPSPTTAPTAAPTATPVTPTVTPKPVTPTAPRYSDSYNNGTIVNEVNEYSRMAARAARDRHYDGKGGYVQYATRFSDKEANMVAGRLMGATKKMTLLVVDLYKRINPALVKDKQTAIAFEHNLRNYVLTKKKSGAKGYLTTKDLYGTLKSIIEHRKFGGTLDDFRLKLYLAKGGSLIVKALAGIKTPWFSKFTKFDPSGYKSLYDPSKLVSIDANGRPGAPWLSNLNGLGLGRYGQSQGNTRELALAIENNPYYQTFTTDLTNNTQDIAESFRKDTDALIPKNSLASFYGSDGNLRGSWATTNNDIYGRPGKTYDDVNKYTIGTRTDNILGARHNVYGKKGIRYFYKDDKGVLHWVNPKEVTDKYNVSKNGITTLDGMTTWTDYEITGLKDNGNGGKESFTDSDIGKKSILDKAKDYLSNLTSNPGNLYNAVETGKYLLSLKANNDIFKIKAPNLAIAPKHASYQVMDNLALLNAYHLLAANTINSASKPLTSSGQLLAAMLQEGMNNANKLSLQGDAERNNWLETQRLQANKTALYNMESAVDTANANAQYAYTTNMRNDYLDPRLKLLGKYTNILNYVNALEKFNITDPYAERKNAQQLYALAKAQWDYQNDPEVLRTAEAYRLAAKAHANDTNWVPSTSQEYKAYVNAQRDATAKMYLSMYEMYGIKNPQFKTTDVKELKKGGKFDDVSMLNTKEFYNTVRHSINTATKETGDINKLILAYINKKNNKK